MRYEERKKPSQGLQGLIWFEGGEKQGQNFERYKLQIRTEDRFALTSGIDGILR